MPGIESGYHPLRPRQISSSESHQVIHGDLLLSPFSPVFSEPSESQQRRQFVVIAVEPVVLLEPVRLRERDPRCSVVDFAEEIEAGGHRDAAHASKDTTGRR